MKRFLLFALMAISLFSCRSIGGVEGNGNIITKDFPVESFTGIRAWGIAHVKIMQGHADVIKVTTDENLMKYLHIKTVGSQLELGTKSGSNIDPTDKIVFEVTLPLLRKLDISGASKAMTAGNFLQDEKVTLDLSGASSAKLQLTCPEINVDLSGASDLLVSGKTNQFIGDQSGSSSINAADMLVMIAEIQSSGASSTKISIADGGTLKFDGSGASNLEYKGNATVNVHTSGAAKLTRIEDK